MAATTLDAFALTIFKDVISLPSAEKAEIVNHILETAQHAVAVTLEHVQLRASKYRATREYRQRMIRTWLPIVLATAAERAGSSR